MITGACDIVMKEIDELSIKNSNKGSGLDQVDAYIYGLEAQKSLEDEGVSPLAEFFSEENMNKILPFFEPESIPKPFQQSYMKRLEARIKKGSCL